MYHPLYPVARRLVGRPVNVHHINGRVYRGQLQSVTPDGIYLMPYNNRVVRMSDSESEVTLDMGPCQTNERAELVYSPAAYFGFGALTGLTVGALASRYYW